MEAMSKLENQNPADVYYSLVGANIEPLSSSSDEYKVISEALYNTTSTEHSKF